MHLVQCSYTEVFFFMCVSLTPRSLICQPRAQINSLAQILGCKNLVTLFFKLTYKQIYIVTKLKLRCLEITVRGEIFSNLYFRIILCLVHFLSNLFYSMFYYILAYCIQCIAYCLHSVADPDPNLVCTKKNSKSALKIFFF